MENLNFKSNVKRLAMNGDKNKVLKFNPYDMNTRKKFYDISRKIFSKQREFDIKVKNLKDGDVEKAFELEQELFSVISNLIDEVFGKGTTKMVTDNTVDVMASCNFLTAIAPYFKEVNEKQKNKYTNNLKSAGLI